MKGFITKTISTVLMASMLLGGAAVAEENITVTLDGNLIEFDVQPTIINDRTMVPLRAIFEALGAEVSYDDATRTITAQDEDTKVVLIADQSEMDVNGEKLTLDAPATIIDGRTLVPVRAVSEAFACNVEWDGENKVVIITTQDEEDDMYSYPSPVIDFSNDTDGTMSKLHALQRYTFEQTYLPDLIFSGDETLKDAIVNAPDEFLAQIDNKAWGECMNLILFNHFLESEEEYVIGTEEDLYKLLNEAADNYSLHAYQSYEADAFMIDEEKYCILLNMADISVSPKLGELDTALISTYVAIVYDSATSEFGYYLLEKSFGGYYAVCSIDADGTHSTYDMIENDKKAFVESVTQIVSGSMGAAASSTTK